jgi:hypothetical protein
MSNWTDEQKKITIFKTTTYTSYFIMESNVINWYAGRLAPNTTVTVNYVAEKDAMKIVNCNVAAAVGKYIISPKDTNDNITIAPTNIVTTEAKTTTDKKTGKNAPVNVDITKDSATEDGSTVIPNPGTEPDNTDTTVKVYINTSDTTVLDEEPADMDDAFYMEYSERYTDTEEYSKNLKNGLRVSDLSGILGMPHQFLPIADPRINIEPTEDGYYPVGGEDQFGRVYSEKIIKHIPLLLMTPGVPVFMSDFSSEKKQKMIAKLGGWVEETLDSIFSDGDSGKYYSLKYAYTEYFKYVNAMLRSAAYFLEIQGEKVNGKRLGELDWLAETTTSGAKVFSEEGLANFLGPYAGSIAFYADAGTSVDDSFSNQTEASSLADGLNNLSNQGRELNFLVGNVGGMAGVKLDTLTGADNLQTTIDDLTSSINGLFNGNGNILSNILGKATTILAGGRVIFPEIWTDSSFSRSYSCSMKLVSPSGDKLSVFLNILVPIYHLLAFTLPRQSANQAYFSPFLVRTYYKGLFNVDMGIIPGLSITKGEEGEWTLDGIPTVANVSFEIKDLYDGMYMSRQTFDHKYDIMSNVQELDYIANSCGVNVNDHEIIRTIKMYTALGFSNVTDKVTINIFGQVSQYFNQKVQNIFGKF